MTNMQRYSGDNRGSDRNHARPVIVIDLDAQQPQTEAAEVDSPETIAQAWGLISRILFAWFATTVFLWGLLTWGRFSIRFMLLFLVIMTLMVMFGNDKVLYWINRVLVRPTIKTNNRWLVWMFGYTLIMVGFTVYSLVSFTTQQASETSLQHSVNIERHADELLAERKRNLADHGKPYTDAEMGKVPESKEFPKLADAVPLDPHRDYFWIRLACSLFLLVLSVGYIGFALSDEVRAAFNEARAALRERAEGRISQAVAAGAAQAAPAVAAAATATYGASFLRTFGSDLSAELVIEAMQAFFRNFSKNAFRR